jgi:hypothetical protein
MEFLARHTGACRYPVRGVRTKSWIPAFAGMTVITHMSSYYLISFCSKSVDSIKIICRPELVEG